jgi:hypothetical protein
MTVFSACQGAFTIMHKVFYRKCSKISKVGCGSCTPELYSVGPDWFEYCKFLVCREF